MIDLLGKKKKEYSELKYETNFKIIKKIKIKTTNRPWRLIVSRKNGGEVVNWLRSAREVGSGNAQDSRGNLLHDPVFF